MSTIHGDAGSADSSVDVLRRAGSAKRTRPSRQCSAHVQDSERNPISSMLAQLMPVSGAFVASQLSSSRRIWCA